MKTKAKTHKASAKRLRLTRTGKVVAAHAYKSHLLAHKSRTRKMKLKKKSVLDKAAVGRIHRILPYG